MVVPTTVTLPTTVVIAPNTKAGTNPAVYALRSHFGDEVPARVCALAIVAHPFGRAVVVVPAGSNGEGLLCKREEGGKTSKQLHVGVSVSEFVSDK